MKVILFIIIVGVIYSVFKYLTKDRRPLEEKFNIIIQDINMGLLNGGGEIVKVSKRDINLFNDNIPNILIHFMYRSGDLMIILRYKYFQQEMVYKKVFDDIDNDIIYADQHLVANEFVTEALVKKEEHENKIIQTIR